MKIRKFMGEDINLSSNESVINSIKSTNSSGKSNDLKITIGESNGEEYFLNKIMSEKKIYKLFNSSGELCSYFHLKPGVGSNQTKSTEIKPQELNILPYTPTAFDDFSSLLPSLYNFIYFFKFLKMFIDICIYLDLL
jgi:hypothetical protein